MVTLHPITPEVAIAIALTIALLLLSGFASGSEIAFFSLSPSDLNELNPDKNSTDEGICRLREDSERTLATILITNNLVNVTIIMLCNFIFGSLVEFKAKWLDFLVITVFLTFLLLLFGEIMPKVYSRSAPLKFCRKVVGGIMLLRKLFWPLETILIKSGVIAEKAVPKEKRQLSVDDLEQALELTDKEDIKDEQSMLKGIIRFGDETAKEIMTPRQDFGDIDIKSTFPEVIRFVVENNYSRIPIYQDNEDNIRGVLYIKDLLPYLGKPDNFRWQSLIRSTYFVPETKKIDDLLHEFQENKIHIAIVVDEFGGTSEEEKNYTRLNSNTYIFEGKTLLSDFCKILGIDDDEFDSVVGDADSLAGLLLELKGDFLNLHEKIAFKNYTFEVMAVEERRISKVKVVVNNKTASNATDKKAEN